MSLRLRRTIAGRPNASTHHSVAALTVDKEAVIVYASSSNVVLLNPLLEVVGTLRIWDALPLRSSSSSRLSDVHGVVAAEGLIIAWTDVHVVIWSRQSIKGTNSWSVHSTVLASDPVTTVDYKEGTLALGTSTGIELWRSSHERDVVFWDRLWSRAYPTPVSICVSPSTSHLAWFQKGHKTVHVLAINKKGQAVGMPQEMRHPREIDWIGWRKSVASSQVKGDAVLYTITTDTVFRIYSPVLDDPSWFQLLSSIDHRAFAKPSIPVSTRKGKDKETNGRFGWLWALDAEVLRAGLLDEISAANEGKSRPSAMTRKILEGLATEESDVLMHLDSVGNLSMRSIVNLDRKPPTLIKSLPIARIRLTVSPVAWSPQAHLVYSPASGSLLALTSTSQRIRCHRLSISELISANSSGFAPIDHAPHEHETSPVNLENAIRQFVRTPNGRGLLAICENGEVGAWSKEQVGKPIRGQPLRKSLAGKGQWTTETTPLQSAIFAKGRAILTYDRLDDKHRITLQHLDEGSDRPTPPVILPDFELNQDDDVAMLLAVSDIDDGLSGRGKRTSRAIAMAVTHSGQAWCWRITSRFALTPPSEIDAEKKGEQPDIQLLHTYRLPIHGGKKPASVLPVDPMGWHSSVIDWKTDTPLQDMVLTISEGGVLEYWQPRLGQHLVNGSEGTEEDEELSSLAGQTNRVQSGEEAWTRSGHVDTGRKNVSMARCSSRKKTVLVCGTAEEPQEVTIWDSNVSEFSTGLELTHFFQQEDSIQDLDWTTTSDLQSVLAIGFPHKVVLVCEQRMSYSEKTPGWAPFVTVNLEKYTTVPIHDSIWLAGGSLAIGAGNQIYLFSRFLDRGTPAPSPSASAKSVVLDTNEPEDLFQLIAWQNGPLLDYHPTVLAQCLIWDKLDLVKRVLVDLHRSLKQSEEAGRKWLSFNRLDPSDFVKSQQNVANSPKTKVRTYDGLFDTGPTVIDEDEDEFNKTLVQDLVERLNGPVEIALTAHDKALLAIIAEGTYEVEQQRRALDLCGLRYLISVELLASHFRRHEPNALSEDRVPHKHRLSFRNIVWASHSESQEMLLTASTNYCTNKKMMWHDAKALGVFLWLKSTEVIKSQLEVVARNTFMAQEDRDPTSCSLIFFALGKKKVVHGLWRQAPGHKEQNMMLKFLGNDFSLDRWKTAALKNAYALLSKNRYEYAAAFFMLADQPRDAISVCLRQMGDWQLAIALAKAIEPEANGPLLKWILSDTVIPLAFEGGHRWLASWAFWSLGRRDLAVRVLISPMSTVASAWSPASTIAVGISENDDPSLLLLFQYLKSKSMQTAKGTSEIPSKVEFDFVLHNARVFFRMGCHSLALDLLRNWSFERPFFPPPQAKHEKAERPQYSPVHQRRPSFMLSNSYTNGHGRRESMVMDLDLLAESEPNGHTRQSHGSDSAIEEEEAEVEVVKPAEVAVKEEVAEEVKPKKMGNLMKEIKQDVTQGAMEFNMDSFF